ncbi:nitric oxide reductase transcriptional regulator NorR [uncultured Propionivibrio sp.]|uniref:nitric oxide reductase transcriptional regulator NorR n=1 Tax=uncultured Propionivibrio sp. TaxID=426737 RepID=UPI0029BFCDB6|nr:nitric oxide reductase transcriptional regulator NorR [uncultured Propionivibrio sp.]
MPSQQAIDRALRQIAVDLSNTMPGEVQFQRLVAAIGSVLPCDAIALLHLQDGVLVPMASQGLAPELMGRRFDPAVHPRLASIIGSPTPVRFPADSTLPDPFDGLIATDADRALPVHACLGCALHVDAELVGALTLDALDEEAFDRIGDSTIAAFAALAAATLRNVALIRALEQASERQRAIARDLMQEAYRREGNLVGNSRAMRRLRQEIATVAATDLAVLITGETGTGKELVARTLHAQSNRSEQALVQINCAALPETVAESELFGHRKGAFTGATADRPGKFELAHGGSLFLDEIGELPLSLQAKLLRALQQGEIQRVGADEIIRVDVRIIAATNRDLQREVDAGRFRSDLYHRLHVYPVAVPPLREHREDLAVLAGHFLDLARHKLGLARVDLHPSALAALAAYDWPGNVRELEHLLLRASLKAMQRDPERTLIQAEDLGLGNVTSTGTEPPAALPPTPTDILPLRQAVEAFQAQRIAAALAACDGNWSQAARQLGIDRANLQRLARRLGIGN